MIICNGDPGTLEFGHDHRLTAPDGHLEGPAEETRGPYAVTGPLIQEDELLRLLLPSLTGDGDEVGGWAPEREDLIFTRPNRPLP